MLLHIGGRRDPSPATTRTRALHGLSVALRCKQAGLPVVILSPGHSWILSEPAWHRLASLGFEETHLALCSFGSPFLRNTVLLASGIDLSSLARPCICKQAHRQAKGRHSAGPFLLPSGLVYELGGLLSGALRARAASACEHASDTGGLERLILTDLALGLDWECDAVWDWKGDTHINILEASTLCRLYLRVALSEGRCRFTNLCDSFVAQAALGKGRSSSPGLRHVTRRASAICLASGLYLGNIFCPTRAMPADHPTRDMEFPEKVPGFGIEGLTEEAVLKDAVRPQLRRWISNWARLACLLRPPLVLGPWPSESTRYASSLPILWDCFPEFDMTLGYPGKGPNALLRFWCSGLAFGLNYEGSPGSILGPAARSRGLLTAPTARVHLRHNCNSKELPIFGKERQLRDSAIP